MANNLFPSQGGTIVINLDTSKYKDSIRQAIRFTEVYPEAVKYAFNYFVEKLIAKFKDNLADAGVGHLTTDITVISTSEYVSIQFNNPEESGALFMEYGTGLAGIGSHPNPPSGWKYNSGPKILPDGNWWYPDDTPYPGQPTFIDAETGQQYARTIHQGQKGRQFVYKTWVWAKRQAQRMINMQIKKYIERNLGGGN